MQPNTNRTPGQSGQPAGESDQQDAFAPGSSFSAEPSESRQSGELPSWLQDFAGAAGDANGTSEARTAIEDTPSLAGWNEPPRRPTADAKPAPAVEPSHGSAGQPSSMPDNGNANFLSEDDLPDWLRALSADGQQSTSSSPVATAVPSSGASTQGVTVPPVSRAWVTATDPSETTASANLLSSLANVLDARPDAVAVESVPNAPTPSVSAPSQAKAAPPAAAVPVGETGRWSRTRLLAIALIVVLVLLVIVFVAGN